MYDKEIGMYYLIARYYNPDHGVLLSVDPDSGDEDDPVTMNGYTYADNNPVMMVDPDGYKAKKVSMNITKEVISKLNLIIIQDKLREQLSVLMLVM